MRNCFQFFFRVFLEIVYEFEGERKSNTEISSGTSMYVCRAFFFLFLLRGAHAYGILSIDAG